MIVIDPQQWLKVIYSRPEGIIVSSTKITVLTVLLVERTLSKRIGIRICRVLG